MTVQLKVANVTTKYRKFTISNVTFSLQSGQVMGLVGRSGSGKSTLLKTILGIKRPEEGTIIATKNNEQVPLSSCVSYSPQDNSLFSFLTLDENLQTFGKLHGLDEQSIKERSDVLLGRLYLTKSRTKRVCELSGGMQKRADLAVTLIHNPDIILLDEPFNGLDVSLQQFIWKFLKDLAREEKIIVISSHMLNDIQTNCDQFGLVERGTFFDTAYLQKELKISKAQSFEKLLENAFARDLQEDSQ